jgi:hypothetical protein
MNRRLPARRLPRSVQIHYETNRLAFTHLRDAYEQLVPTVPRVWPRPIVNRSTQERKELV